MGAGGEAMTEMMAEKISPVLESRNCRMLEIGFGIGGTAMEFSEKYGADVYGIDVNPVGYELAQIALETRNLKRVENGLEPLRVHFMVEDATRADFAKESFDVIYSRDTLLHLDGPTKQELFQRFTEWLVPGGMVCIGDYCLGRNSHNTGEAAPTFSKYLETRGYHMWTPDFYAKALEEAGLDESHGEDLAFWYCATCQREIDGVCMSGPKRDEFLKSHLETTLANLERTYQDKIQMTLRGDRSYVMVTATKRGSHHALRQQVVHAYQQLYDQNYVMSCDGNVSVRIDHNHFLVTPSGMDPSDLDAAKIVLCNRNGRSLEKLRPSSESGLHTLIYQSRPDVHAIVHSHSIYACALACCRLPLPPTHYGMCALIHDTSHGLPNHDELAIKCTDYHTYGTWDLAVASLVALGKNHAVLLANHGAVVVGPDLKTTMQFTQRLERECEIYWRSMQLGIPKSLTREEVVDLHQRDQSYGPVAQIGIVRGDSSTSSADSSDPEECIEEEQPYT
jgi:L-fuculose-phosphate aldolase